MMVLVERGDDWVWVTFNGLLAPLLKAQKPTPTPDKVIGKPGTQPQPRL